MAVSTLALVKQGLITARYREDRLRESVPVPNAQERKAGLVAYRDQPFDARTSTLVAVDGAAFSEEDLPLLRDRMDDRFQRRAAIDVAKGAGFDVLDYPF